MITIFDFFWIENSYELIDEDAEFGKWQELIVLFHYALGEWNAVYWGTYHLWGHSHGTLSDNPVALAFDIDVDCYGFIHYLIKK